MKRILVITLLSLGIIAAAHGTGLATDVAAKNYKTGPEEEESYTFPMDAIVVTASRIDRKLNTVAENMSLLTSEDIEATGAHNLGEALESLPGLTVQRNGGPWANALAQIQGSSDLHVTVLVDGMPMNTLAEGSADLSLLPIGAVERIEVIKGAASSVWGSALGGVINVITKSPEKDLIPKGCLTVRVGRWNTRSYSLNLSHRIYDKVGYLLSASHAETDGFKPKTDYEGDQAFFKLNLPLGEDSNLSGSFGYNEGEMGLFKFVQAGFWQSQRYLKRDGNLKLKTKVTDALDLTIAFLGVDQEIKLYYYPIGSDEPFKTAWTDERTTGLRLQATGRPGARSTFVWGLDVDRSTFEVQGRRSLTQKAVYFNDQTLLGNWVLNLGLRYDDNSAYGSQLSPSLGLVYNVPLAKTLLRGVITRGFSAPPLSFKYYEEPPLKLANPEIGPERAWVYELGIESHPLPTLWGKLTLFRSNISDVIGIAVVDTIEVPSGNTTVAVPRMRQENFEKEERMGLELELRMRLPLGFTLKAGAAFNDVRNPRNDKAIPNRPIRTYDIGVNYANRAGFRADLIGHYVWWNLPKDFGPKDRRFIWDLNISHQTDIPPVGELKAFLVGHNIFNAQHGWTRLYPQPRRWYEAGLTWEF